MAEPIDSILEHAERASRLAEERSLLMPEIAMSIRARTSRRRTVHRLIQIWDRRARRPRYGVMDDVMYKGVSG
jgi:hypothetical protein